MTSDNTHFNRLTFKPSPRNADFFGKIQAFRIVSYGEVRWRVIFYDGLKEVPYKNRFDSNRFLHTLSTFSSMKLKIHNNSKSARMTHRLSFQRNGIIKHHGDRNTHVM